MDIGQSIFEYGQTYVALSRIRSLDGLYLSDFQSDRIKANPKVIEFYNTIRTYNTQELKKNELCEEEYHEEKPRSDEIKNIRLL